MASVSVRQKLFALGPFEICNNFLAKNGYFEPKVATPPIRKKAQIFFSRSVKGLYVENVQKRFLRSAENGF